MGGDLINYKESIIDENFEDLSEIIKRKSLENSKYDDIRYTKDEIANFMNNLFDSIPLDTHLLKTENNNFIQKNKQLIKKNTRSIKNKSDTYIFTSNRLICDHRIH